VKQQWRIIMDIEIIDFEKEIEKLESPRRPHDMVFVDDSLLRAVLCEGEGKWYVHDYDEFFMHYRGEVVIESDTTTGPIPKNLLSFWCSGTNRQSACWHK
jgi:hypothetical protein